MSRAPCCLCSALGLLDCLQQLHVYAAVLEEPHKYLGQTIPIVGEHLSYSEMAKILSEVTGMLIMWVHTAQKKSSLPCSRKRFGCLHAACLFVFKFDSSHNCRWLHYMDTGSHFGTIGKKAEDSRELGEHHLYSCMHWSRLEDSRFEQHMQMHSFTWT